MKMRIFLAVLVLGVLSTGAQAGGCFMNQGFVVAPAAVATPVALIPAYHVMSQQVGTGLMVVGRHTGFNYDRMRQDLVHPQGAVVGYGIARPVVFYYR